MYQKFHSTQTWTFKGRTQTITGPNRPSAFPGPSDYKYDKPAKHFGTTIVGKDKRKVFEVTNHNPGPGTYKSMTFTSDGPKRSMSARIPIRLKDTPGPGSYKPNYNELKQRLPQYTISAKQKTEWTKKDSELQPAPNTYNPQQISPTKSVYLSNTKRRSLSELQKTPGPAAYISNDLMIYKNTPSTIIGSETRKQFIPAPNTYNIHGFSENDKKDHKGYTMRPMTADPLSSSRKGIPGPGKYDVSNSNKHIRGFSNGTNKRTTFIDDTIKQSTIPGAGSYNPKLTQSTVLSGFGVSKRKHPSEYQTTPGPGPGNYDLTQSSKFTQSKTPRYSMSKSAKGLKNFFNTKQGIPGPGKYQPIDTLTKQSSKLIQMSKSTFLKDRKGLDAPGVGTYQIPSPKGIGWSFKKQKRKGFTDQNTTKNNPGPSAYSTQTSFPNPPKYMMSSSYKSRS